MLRPLTTISFHCMCSLKRTGPLCWTLVTGDSGETGRVAARVLPGVSRGFLVHVSSCWLVGMQGIQATFDDTQLGQEWESSEALVNGWWRCDDCCGERYHVNSNFVIVSDLLRKSERFRHAVLEPFLSRCFALSDTVSRSRACWRSVCRSFLPQL